VQNSKAILYKISKGILAYARSKIILMSHLWEKKNVVVHIKIGNHNKTPPSSIVQQLKNVEGFY
jgi:predicted RNase H-related nuclease YkuK (DUF458 family)